MQIYYYVYQIKKGKCKFIFSYLKTGSADICGSASVDFSCHPMKVAFDDEFELGLDDKEKRAIISEVLLNIKL